MIDTSTPSRTLDAAVAKAMGHVVYAASSDGYQEWDGKDAESHLLFINGRYDKVALPFYSQPTTFYSQAAVLDMILWLMKRNIVLLERTKEGKTLVDLTDGGPDEDSDAIPGEPLQALALALCQVVVRVGGEKAE